MDPFEEVARVLFGTTPRESPLNCIRCKQVFSPINVRTEVERKETKLSGLCGVCWDELFKEEMPTTLGELHKLVKKLENKVARLSAAITSPTLVKITEIFECHGVQFEAGFNHNLTCWSFTIEEPQHPALLTALFELGPNRKMMLDKNTQEWHGLIYELPDVPTVAVLVGVKIETKPNGAH